MNDKILSLLGLCRRAGKLTPGADAVLTKVQKGKSKLVIVAGDISKNTQTKLSLACDRANVKLIKLSRSKQQLGKAIGKLCAVVSVSDKGFAQRLDELIEDENREVIVYDKVQG